MNTPHEYSVCFVIDDAFIVQILSRSINMVGPIQWSCNTVRKMKNICLATRFLFGRAGHIIKCLTYIACHILKWCQTMLSPFLSITANFHANLIKSNMVLNKVFISTINCELPPKSHKSNIVAKQSFHLSCQL